MLASIPRLQFACGHPEPAYAGGMKLTILFPKTTMTLRRLLLAACLAGLSTSPGVRGADAPNEFSKPSIDMGIVVKDAARTAKFLTEAIGFKEVNGFSVTPDLGRKIGLVDGHAVDVRVFVLDDVECATRIKVLSFPAAGAKQPDQQTIHATLGMRYLTLFVKDMNRALERLKQAKVPLLGETPLDLGGGTFIVVVKDPDGNFIELIGPRKS
jgi:catechol 2,3-dioxygenase-like lactoylglutathione lyase family enzyme